MKNCSKSLLAKHLSKCDLVKVRLLLAAIVVVIDALHHPAYTLLFLNY